MVYESGAATHPSAVFAVILRAPGGAANTLETIVDDCSAIALIGAIRIVVDAIVAFKTGTHGDGYDGDIAARWVEYRRAWIFIRCL